MLLLSMSSLSMLDTLALFLQVFSPSECCHAASRGESGGFSLICGVLTVYGAFAVIFTPFTVLWLSVHTLDASIWSLQPFGLPERWLVVPLGEFGGFKLFGHVLTVLLSFAAIFMPVSTLWLPVHALNLSMRFLKAFEWFGLRLLVPIGEFWGFKSF